MTQNRRITMSEGLFMAIVRFHHLPPLFKSSYNQVSDLLCQILALILQCVELTFFFFCLSDNLILCLHSDAQPSVYIFF